MNRDPGGADRLVLNRPLRGATAGAASSQALTDWNSRRLAGPRALPRIPESPSNSRTEMPALHAC